jgi:hypothetical protein
MDTIQQHSLLAWVGQDPTTGAQTVKRVQSTGQALTSIDYDRAALALAKDEMEKEAEIYGRKIRLVRFAFAEILDETAGGE